MSICGNVWGVVKEYVFPVMCLGCGQEGAWVCIPCFSAFDHTVQLFCPLCHAPTAVGKCCASCLAQDVSFPLQQVVASVRYRDDGLIGKIIHALKYEYAEEVKGVISQVVERSIREHIDLFPSDSFTIAVPLHTMRFVERGFNQADIIAQSVNRALGVPGIEHALVRHRDTPHQATLARVDRLQNVADAFSVRNPSRVRGCTIILVDDVYTTGATMQACATALLRAGARSVSAYTLARG